MSDATVLHVDPGGDRCERLRNALSGTAALSVVASESVGEAERRLRAADVDCLVAACELPDGTGLELVERAREVAPDLGCVLYGSERPSFGDADAELVQVEFVPSDVDGAVGRVLELVRTTARERTQTTYPLPDREHERLATLERYDLDDETALPELQDVVDHAAERLDVTQATINVIAEDEQYFAVCHDEDWAPIPRQDSICTYAILDPEPTVVDDAESDPRFEGNDVLEDLGVRSYAAAPIAPDRDPPIATLCVYDDSPDRFDGVAASYLQSLARDAAAVIAGREAGEVDQ